MIKGTLSRAAKGRVAPAPRLPPAAQAVADEVAALPGVAVQAHWEIGSQTVVDGTDFYVGEAELGHVHLDGEAHVPVGRTVADAMIRARLAGRFRWSPDFVVIDTADREAASWAFALRRAQIDGTSTAALLGRVRDRAARRE